MILAADARASPAEEASRITSVTAASIWEGVGRFILKKIGARAARGAAGRGETRRSRAKGERGERSNRDTPLLAGPN